MDPNTNETQSSIYYLFGGSKPWHSSDWTASDDRVRSGSSVSHLVINHPPSSSSYSSPSPPSPSPSPSSATTTTTTATFTGTLDTHTLGGAGFASQRTTATDLGLDLRPYAGGIAMALAKADGKRYTLVLKDEIPPPREDGREMSGLGWEAEFGGEGDKERGEEGDEEEDSVVRLRWEDFRAVYRGREKKGAREFRRGEVKRVAIMCRSFFGEQEGDFELVIKSISAIKEDDDNVRYRDDPDVGSLAEPEDEKRTSGMPVRKGWLRWIFGACWKL